MSKKEIFDTLAKYSTAWDRQIPESRLQIYTEALFQKGFNFKQVDQALRQIVFKSKFFPSLAEIYFELSPEPTQDDAVKLAGDILKAVMSYSRYDSEGIRKKIGDDCMEIIDRLGGIEVLSTVTYSDLPTTRAQLERMCKAMLRYKYSTGKLLEQNTASISSPSIAKIDSDSQK